MKSVFLTLAFLLPILAWQPSDFNNQCLRCMIASEEKSPFTIVNINLLSEVRTNDHYFCTFDKTCRGSNDKA